MARYTSAGLAVTALGVFLSGHTGIAFFMLVAAVVLLVLGLRKEP